MLKTKSFILGLFSAIIISGNSYALNSKTDFLITLENNPKTEFQLAKSTFLPETFDDLGLSGRDNTKYNHNTANKCIGYNLNSCPTNAICSQCPSNSKMFKFKSCESGYRKSGNACKPLSCSDLGYLTEIPANKVCTLVTSGSLSCYKDCQSVSCDEYTINCDSFNVANSAGKEVCPVCNNANANCSPKRCKVSSCLDGYKVSNDGKSCIVMDDACPDGYYKECETGTTGEPEYTELGTACYKCKAKVETVMLPILYADMTTSTGVNSGKTPIGVVFDEDKKLAVALDSLTKVWATSSFDIPDLSTYSTAATALSDWNGKANTKNINSFCQANDKSCPASEYAIAYTTKGTSAGDWYIPALGELNAIYTKLPSINTTLERINGTVLPTETYWSSSKYNTNGSIWNHYFGNGNAYHGNSGYNLHLRLVINYGDSNKDLPILYSDLTTSTEVISGKTPIGVVIDESKKLAVALSSARKVTTDFFDVPDLNNHSSTTEALADWNGKTNTKTFINYCKTNSKSCPAAEYAYGYKTAGTSTGDWYLPALGELNALYTNKDAINEALTKVNGIPLEENQWHWSSSKSSDRGSFWQQLFNGGPIRENIAINDLVRPVINYGDVSKPLPILYSDLTTSTEVISGKTPIGVVIDESKKLAVALIETDKVWATSFFDVPNVTNYNYSVNNWDGKANTQAIVDYCKTNSKSCPAAEYAYGYKTAGTSSGDWYLPAMEELKLMFNKKDSLNTTLLKLNYPINDTTDFTWYWTSNEYTEMAGTREIDRAWDLNYINGYGQINGKNTNQKVRPYINYGDVNKVCTPKTKCPTEISKVYSTPTYKVHKYQFENGCGGSLTCYREKSCDEACPPAQTPSCPCTDSWGNQSTTCSDENIQKCRETCLEHCNKYPSDECWWIGCAYTNI